MTPRELVDLIYRKAAEEGTPPAPAPSRRDTFKIGDPDARITGIATTGMATFRVLRRAVAERRNFIITHEDTWFRDNDIVDFLGDDPIYLAKKAFIDRNKLIIWRNHDLAHRMRPDPLFAGQLRALGWVADPIVPAPRMPIVTLPKPMTLRALARYAAGRTGTHSHRVVGDPDMIVRKVAVGVGYAFPSLPSLPDVDAIVGGESAEGSAGTLPTMDQSAFAADMTTLGHPRGIIFLGHMGTEDSPMQLVANWLGGFVRDIPIAFLPAGEPFHPPLSGFTDTR
ncbi:Nif3-like dinuclear metal center hexameric protein [Sphingomonas sp.]|uniref:Nif3-like dinuclear metal center hexameric protein n=1 Tax=Sphingomonas sp. TaxID=28214 RepID=UPI003B3BCA4E